MKLSIITTVYQAERDLPRLLDSMKAQKSHELEFFLINNGCTDGSSFILEKYANEDSRFHVHTLSENIGYINARNLGLSIVEADYVGFCDSDDYIEAGAYDSLILKIKESFGDMYIGGWRTIGQNNHITHLPPFCIRPYIGYGELREIIPQFFGNFCGKRMLNGFMWKQVFRLSIIRDNNLRFLEKLKPYEDMLFNAQFIKNSNIVVATDIILYNYIINAESITSRLISNYCIEEEIKRIDDFIGALKAEAVDDGCTIATANQALAMFITMLSFSARSYAITPAAGKINQYVTDALIDIIKLSKPRLFSQQYVLRLLVTHRMFRVLMMIFKVRNR